MKILGVDPGTTRVGWSVVHVQNSLITIPAYGCIIPDIHTKSDTERLLFIYRKMNELISAYTPNVVSVEELFFATNAKTAISVGQARGVIILSAALADIQVVSYTPLVVKQTITGSGKADKTQVARMIVSIMKLKETPKPDDVTDACAIALTHAYSYKLKQKLI